MYASPPLRPGTHRLEYRDETFPGRIGWKEVVVQHDSGASVLSTSAPARSVSDELRAYPKDQLSSPLDVRSARLEVDPGTGSGVAPELSSGKALDSRVTVHQGGDGGFAGLIAKEKLSAGFVALALLLAFFWGAVHALSPGHGKSIVAAYLVGTRGTPRHAAFLGLTVTVTHTVGVFALGLITLALSAFIFPEQLYPWLNLASALLVVVVGCGVLRARLRHRRMHSARPPPPPPPPWPQPRPRPAAVHARLARSWDLRRADPVPDRAGRAARGDLAAPRRLRARADPRFQHGPRRRHDWNRIAGRLGQEAGRASAARGTRGASATCAQRCGHTRARSRHDRPRPAGSLSDVRGRPLAVGTVGRRRRSSSSRASRCCSACVTRPIPTISPRLRRSSPARNAGHASRPPPRRLMGCRPRDLAVRSRPADRPVQDVPAGDAPGRRRDRRSDSSSSRSPSGCSSGGGEGSSMCTSTRTTAGRTRTVTSTEATATRTARAGRARRCRRT